MGIWVVSTWGHMDKASMNIKARSFCGHEHNGACLIPALGRQENLGQDPF
jgi:hypothetical protein